MLALDGMTPIPGYVRVGTRWNGWECPVFDLAVIRAHRDALIALFADDIAGEYPHGFTFDADDMPHLIEWWGGDPAEESDVVTIVEIDGREYVDIGSWSYCWSAVGAR